MISFSPPNFNSSSRSRISSNSSSCSNGNNGISCGWRNRRSSSSFSIIFCLVCVLSLLSHCCFVFVLAAHSHGHDHLANVARTSAPKRKLYPKKSLSSEPSKCDASVKRLRSAILVKEEEVLELREEATYLSKLAARTIRKGLHCLSLQLTIQYYNHLRKETHSTNRTILEDDRLYHYIIYSENVLAAAVVVNSTTTNAKEPRRLVFHILTDSLNYAAMQMWFWAYSPDKATVEVTNLDNISISHIFEKPNEQARRKQLQLDPLQTSIMTMEKENSEKPGILDYLPRVFPKLDRVFLLDDDIVILKDLSPLWQLKIGNNMIIASNSCKASQDDGVWWSCVNLVNLREWRTQRPTKINQLPIDSSNLNHLERETSNIDYVLLDNATHIFNVDGMEEVQNDVRDAEVVHYGGYAKPWLELGMGRYKSFWTRFVNFDNPILQECNVHK